MPICLSTEDVTLKERLPYWNHVVSGVLGRLDMRSQQSSPFMGTISYAILASIPMATVASTALRVLRPERFICDPHEDFFKINFHLKGDVILHQNGHTAWLQPGDWVIYDNTRPYELLFHSDYRQLLFLIPRQQLLRHLPTVEDLLAHPFPSHTGTGKVLLDFTRSTLQASDSLPAPVASRMAQMLCELLVLGLAEHSPAVSSLSLQASTRLLQVKQFIATHLHNPELSIEMIAHALHLSKRHLHTLFKESGTTLNRYIWQQRLEKCHHELRLPHHAHRSISEIAFSWGFSSSAHFSRLFKKRYGMSAREYRKGLC